MRSPLLCRYYDGQLVADDEMAAAAGGSECRDVVLAPPPPEAPAGSMPRPAAAAGSGSGLVLLSRAYSEDKLYTQVRGGVVLLRPSYDIGCCSRLASSRQHVRSGWCVQTLPLCLAS
jgi:hypothetical protein